MRILIDGMDELSEAHKRAKEEYDLSRSEVLTELTDVWDDHFLETDGGVRRKADVIRASIKVVQETILEDLTEAVQSSVTERVVNHDAFMEAVIRGEIDPAIVTKITDRVISQERLNAAIERNEIPMAVVAKHTTVQEKKPYAKIARKV